VALCPSAITHYKNKIYVPSAYTPVDFSAKKRCDMHFLQKLSQYDRNCCAYWLEIGLDYTPVNGERANIKPKIEVGKSRPLLKCHATKEF
jgi:hypothetical protein